MDLPQLETDDIISELRKRAQTSTKSAVTRHSNKTTTASRTITAAGPRRIASTIANEAQSLHDSICRETEGNLT